MTQKIEYNYFIPVNFQKLIYNNSDESTQESMHEYEFEYNFNLQEQYHESLLFFSKKPIIQIEFEFFSSNKGLRDLDFYINQNFVQEYFFKKYQIKYFDALDVDNKLGLPVFNSLFNYDTKITIDDFINVIKPNLKVDLLKIKNNIYEKSNHFKLMFHWDFFINEVYFNIENTLVSRYSTSISIGFINEFKNEVDLFLVFFNILFETTHSTVDTHLNGLLFPKEFNFSTETLKFFDAGAWSNKVELFPKERDFNSFYKDNFFEEKSFVDNAKNIVKVFSKNIPVIQVI